MGAAQVQPAARSGGRGVLEFGPVGGGGGGDPLNPQRGACILRPRLRPGSVPHALCGFGQIISHLMDEADLLMRGGFISIKDAGHKRTPNS